MTFSLFCSSGGSCRQKTLLVIIKGVLDEERGPRAREGKLLEAGILLDSLYISWKVCTGKKKPG